ncbi:MAG: S8/S53 family peptidase [Planctomycetota bacterium]
MNSLAGRTVLCAVFFAAVAATQNPERAVPGRWIVTLRDRSFDLEAYRQAIASDVAVTAMDDVLADLEARMHADQAPVVEAVETLGGRVAAQWWIVNGMAIELPAAQVDQLRKNPRVASILADEVRYPGIKTSTNAANHATDLVQAAGVRGDGVTIAFIDSGVDENMSGTGRPHATFYIDGDINNRNGGGIGGSRLLANVQLGRVSPDDLIGHGTSVTGVGAGARWNTTNVADDGHAPRAKIVSYCVANDASGGTLWSILTTAWQQVAIDRVRYGIVVANCSYEGTYDLAFSDQIAIDTVATFANVVITGMAGNGGSGQGYGYGATNMLAVGACEHDTRLVAPFSLRGPSQTQPPRYYPDLIANGVNIVMPQADLEAGSRTAQGTSYSCAQVAGAAALYRSVRPSANAMEVRAAILATTEDVLDRQLVADRNRNAIGHGYLRVDRLIHAARNAAITTTAVATSVGQILRYPLPVRANEDYTIAIAWFRDASRMAYMPWANLDLALYDGTTLLVRQAATGNLDEVIRWHATATGQLTIEVQAVRLDGGAPQPFALVATNDPRVTGTLTSFGSACSTSGFATPGLAVAGAPAPEVGASYWIDCSPTGYVTPPLIPMVMFLGASGTRYQGIPLPIDLTPFGAPGCSLLVSADIQLPVPFNVQGGVTRMSFPVPNQRVLIGHTLYHQAVLVDARLNTMGALFSNAVAALVGGVR